MSSIAVSASDGKAQGEQEECGCELSHMATQRFDLGGPFLLGSRCHVPGPGKVWQASNIVLAIFSPRLGYAGRTERLMNKFTYCQSFSHDMCIRRAGICTGGYFYIYNQRYLFHPLFY